MQKVLVLEGDGIGPSIVDAAVRVLSDVTGELEFINGDIGFSAYEKCGQYLPAETLDLAAECEIILCGPVLFKAERGTKDPVATLKSQLDIYAMVKHFETLSDELGVPGIRSTLWTSWSKVGQDIIETRDIDGITLTKYVRSSSYSRMMAKALSDHEHGPSRGKVTCVTRSDLFPEATEMFVDSFQSLFGAGDWPTEIMDIQRWVSMAIKKPTQFDTVICADLYGHVAAGVMAGLTGGNHLSPNAFIGDSTALFEPGHVYPSSDIPGDHANPTSMMIAGAMALFNIGMSGDARRIMDALKQAYADHETTPDVLGGTLSTEAFTDAVLKRI